ASFPAQAQRKQVEPFDAEQIVIAFYKTGGAIPNFKKWITGRDPYRTTPLALRPEVMEREMARLKNAYHSFDPADDLIIIRTNAVAKAAQYQDPEDPSAKTTVLEMRFPAGDADYFPYDFMEDRFAVIPRDLAKHMKPRL